MHLHVAVHMPSNSHLRISTPIRIEDGLVNHESPFCGSKQFGMCYVSQEGGLASVGCILEIQEHVRLEDGRILITNKGENWATRVLF